MKNKESHEVRSIIHSLAQKKRNGNLPLDRSFDYGRMVDPTQIFSNSHVKYDFTSISSVAVIGNSGKLKNESYGSLIDTYDCVIRMNTAPVSGYEKHVGTKTDFRFVNGELMKGKNQNFSETGSNWLSTIAGERIVFTPTTESGYNKGIYQSVNANQVYFLSDEMLGLVNDFSNRHGIGHCSIGLLSTLVALKFGDVVDLFGFGFHMEDQSMKHYWEQMSEGSEGDHNWEREKEIVMSMNFLGYINIKDLFG